MKRSFVQIVLAVLLTSGLGSASAFAQPAPVDLRIVAINDLHGYLRPPPGGIRIANPDDRSQKIAVPAGGVETMATVVRQLRKQAKNSIFVAAGDLIRRQPVPVGHVP